jgi:glycine C-acetyltransferase
MRQAFYDRTAAALAEIEAQGMTKPERVIVSSQEARVRVRHGGGVREAVNLCANNYLGLASDTRVVEAARRAAADWGAGLASVRFICGTQALHKELEAAIAAYLGHDDAILFAGAFDANGGLFEVLLGEEDAVVSDALNHASIIDGVRLSKARRFRFANGNMDDLEHQLSKARAEGARTILITTDGVFSMDGYFADLRAIVELADRFDALVMVDDCHASGFIGPGGRGTPALHAVEHRIDILTGTLGKALGGAMGGFVAARSEVIALLRQRSRPYLFSNSIAPAICGAALAAIEVARSADGDELRACLERNAARLRQGLSAAGFTLLPGRHPIAPVMLGDARIAQEMAARLLEEGVLVSGFSFPVVPKGQARIRTQISAAHTAAEIDFAIAAFRKVGEALGIFS